MLSSSTHSKLCCYKIFFFLISSLFPIFGLIFPSELGLGKFWFFEIFFLIMQEALLLI